MLQHSRTIQQISESTRQHAVGALRNLSAAPRRYKMKLCEYKNGGHLLDVLTDAALNDTCQQVKDRAFAAIHNLAIQDTACKMVRHPALVLALKDVLLREQEEDAELGTYQQQQQQGQMQQQNEGTPKSHASATLLVLERSITPDMDSYENLQDLLEAINPSNTNDNNETAEETAAMSDQQQQQSEEARSANNNNQDNNDSDMEVTDSAEV